MDTIPSEDFLCVDQQNSLTVDFGLILDQGAHEINFMGIALSVRGHVLDSCLHHHYFLRLHRAPILIVILEPSCRFNLPHLVLRT